MNWKASGLSALNERGRAGRAGTAVRRKVACRRPANGAGTDLATGFPQRSVIFASMLSLLLATAAFADAEFKSASSLYDAGKYADAVAVLERITPKTAAIFFNLGNARFRQEQLGRAVLDFERARQLAPTDPDILANLRFAEERLGVTEVNRPVQPLARFEEAVAGRRTIGQWAHYEVAGVWLMVLCVAGAIWLPRLRTGFAIGAVVAGVGLAIAGAALSARVLGERIGPRAVVLAQKAPARFAPLTDATIHFQLSEGTKVWIREDRGQWWLIERADGQQGWIQVADAERVLSDRTAVW